MYSIIYDKEFIAEAHDAEVYAAGKAKGKTVGRLDLLNDLLSDGIITSEQAQHYSPHSNSEPTP